MQLPQGMNWMTPCLTVEDVEKSATFYQHAFGFTIKTLAPGEDGSIWHGKITYQGQIMLMLSKVGAYDNPAQTPEQLSQPSAVNLYVYCEDVNKRYEQALQSGAQGLTAPMMTFWGNRMCRLLDIDGYTWCFATPIENRA